MKKTIISIILSLIVATVAAQTNQYPGETGTISKSGYTYKYRNEQMFVGEVDPWRLELYNTANRYIDIEWAYRDGSRMSFEKAMGTGPNNDFTASSQTVNQTLAMVDGCFTAQQKVTLRGKAMSIVARFDPSTGRIADIYFSFNRDEPFMNIPVETYRSVELALKQNLTITVTNEGRRLNYISLYWRQKF